MTRAGLPDNAKKLDVQIIQPLTRWQRGLVLLGRLVGSFEGRFEEREGLLASFEQAFEEREQAFASFEQAFEEREKPCKERDKRFTSFETPCRAYEIRIKLRRYGLATDPSAKLRTKKSHILCDFT